MGFDGFWVILWQINLHLEEVVVNELTFQFLEVAVVRGLAENVIGVLLICYNV